MANGDDLDPYPPGSAYPMYGLSSNDPLVDWASNMKPSDLQQYVHDPEGFKQNMINSGQPPPSHNYVQGSDGLQAVDQSNQPIRQLPNGKLSGNITSPLEPPAGPGASRGGGSLGFAGDPFGPSPWDEQLERQFRGEPTGSKQPVPQAPPAKVPDRLPGMTGPTVGAGVAPPPAPVKPPPVAASTTPPYVPEAEPEPAAEKKLQTAEKEKAKADKKVEAYSSEAMSDFAKSMQGVQVPKRPALPGVGTPGVRSPVGIQPGVQNLLALAGQGRPASQQLSLMKLLGRA